MFKFVKYFKKNLIFVVMIGDKCSDVWFAWNICGRKIRESSVAQIYSEEKLFEENSPIKI